MTVNLNQILPQLFELDDYRIIDISMPISSSTAAFPGDVPFSKAITLSKGGEQLVNLTAFTMSPHIGTHADAPLHIRNNLKDYNNSSDTAGQIPLPPFLGPAYVIDLAKTKRQIMPEDIRSVIDELEPPPKRVLFKTSNHKHDKSFEKEYAYFSDSVIDYLAAKQVKLIGIDTPSVDQIHSKELNAHHRLLQNNMVWLENLALSEVQQGMYFLIALPLKFMELEASPVRAVLLDLK